LDSKILGASISPNQDLLILATEAGMLISLDNNFDV
jgi:hypothetical protein